MRWLDWELVIKQYYTWKVYIDTTGVAAVCSSDFTRCVYIVSHSNMSFVPSFDNAITISSEMLCWWTNYVLLLILKTCFLLNVGVTPNFWIYWAIFVFSSLPFLYEWSSVDTASGGCWIPGVWKLWTMFTPPQGQLLT